MKSEIELQEETVIELSKTRLLLLLLGAIVFVGLGIWMVTLDPAEAATARRYNPIVITGFGFASILFFGACGLFALRKLFDRTPGMVFNKDGFVDNASAVGAGFTPWAEVVRIVPITMQRQKILSVTVKDPEKYIAKGNPLQQMANRANLKMMGTPINISALTLKIEFNELVTIFQAYLKYSRAKPDPKELKLGSVDISILKG